MLNWREAMKQGEVFLGIVLIVCGTILFELKNDFFIMWCGLILLGAGVFLYLFAVESSDGPQKKDRKASSKIPRSLP
jgi:hypothetical protein